MKSPDDLITRLTRAENRQAHQGRAGRIESSSPIGLQPRFERGGALTGGNRPPVLGGGGNRHLPLHFLSWPSDALPAEAGPEHSVSSHDFLPRVCEACDIQVLLQAANNLLHIHTGFA